VICRITTAQRYSSGGPGWGRVKAGMRRVMGTCCCFGTYTKGDADLEIVRCSV